MSSTRSTRWVTGPALEPERIDEHVGRQTNPGGGAGVPGQTGARAQGVDHCGDRSGIDTAQPRGRGPAHVKGQTTARSLPRRVILHSPVCPARCPSRRSGFRNRRPGTQRLVSTRSLPPYLLISGWRRSAGGPEIRQTFNGADLASSPATADRQLGGYGPRRSVMPAPGVRAPLARASPPARLRARS